MASSGKFDLSSISPDKPLYNSAQRGPYTVASLDRSSSFRDKMENPILSSLPSMSRSTSTVTQVDVTNFLQCLRFDPKSMVSEHKFNRNGDFKRLASGVLGLPDESLSGSSKGKMSNSSPDDLKRLKAGLRESIIKARERMKVFSETLLAINKCFPSIPSRKRSRPDALPGDRSSGLLLNRAPTGVNVNKLGTQNHSLTNSFDFEQQKVEERGKIVIPRKRTRTSMVDQRAEARPSTPARSSGNVDRDKEVLPVVADGWEKAKMKKKRTGIKADTVPSPSSFSTKAIDGYREPKQGMHPRHLSDAMSRLNDSHGFRPGATNGVGGPTKLHAVARGPRSGSSVVPKQPSKVVQRSTASSDWDLVHGSNKNPKPFGSNNRKRTPSTRSSSPPVTQWADRRPQKISRTARRTNLVPILSSNDDVIESGPGFTKRFKSKGDHFQSSTLLSESEESGAGEQIPKVSNLVLGKRKNKTVNGRGFASARGVIRDVGTVKQLRTARLGVDKSESKLGRPPTRKLSDRKAYTRQKQTAVDNAADFLVGSDDGPEELVAAANAVINPNCALSSPFWRQMEPLFGFVSDADMSYLKHQGSTRCNSTTVSPLHLDVDNSVTLPNGTENRSTDPSPEHYAPGTLIPGNIPLCQRLLAALISEENDEFNEDHTFNIYGSGLEFETDQSLHNYEFGENGAFSDYPYNGLLSDPAMPPGMNFTEYQYGNMPLTERLLLEIHSIGLYPELVPDLPHNGNESINGEIRRLEEKHHEQASKKKNVLENLFESTNEERELQEKDFEQHCLDKLTNMAYRKYTSCLGSKMAKQAALRFVNRTLNRCHEFEATGKSCFTDPVYIQTFRSRSSHLTDTQLDTATDCVFSSDNNTFDFSEQNISKDNVWSSKVKKRELYLDDVIAGTSSHTGTTILNNAKGKRSERDRNGKSPKIGRPASNKFKGERKNKTKIKQKTTPLETFDIKINSIKKTDVYTLPENTEEEEPLDFSHLQLPEMDGLVEQGEDIGSWLNIDDEILQDDAFMGLEIPMDDLSDLNMMV